MPDPFVVTRPGLTIEGAQDPIPGKPSANRPEQPVGRERGGRFVAAHPAGYRDDGGSGPTRLDDRVGDVLGIDSGQQAAEFHPGDQVGTHCGRQHGGDGNAGAGHFVAH